MKQLFAEIPQTSMTFHLVDSEVDAKISKKLSNLGLPDIYLEYPLNLDDQFIHEGNGLYRQGDFSCGSFSIISVTEDGTFSTVFDPKSNTVQVMLNGRFFCGNYLEDNSELKEIDRVDFFVAYARLKDVKGKRIPITPALVEKETHNSACWKIHAKFILLDSAD